MGKVAQHIAVKADPVRYANKLRFNRESARRRRELGKKEIRDPLKVRARKFVINGVHRGTLVRKPCVICGGGGAAQAHHEDYSKPREIVWLCVQHHTDVHAGKIAITADQIVVILRGQR